MGSLFTDPLSLYHPFEDEKTCGQKYHIKSEQKTQPRGAFTQLSRAQDDFHGPDRGENHRDHQREQDQRKQQLFCPCPHRDRREQSPEDAESKGSEESDEEQGGEQV